MLHRRLDRQRPTARALALITAAATAAAWAAALCAVAPAGADAATSPALVAGLARLSVDGPASRQFAHGGVRLRAVGDAAQATTAGRASILLPAADASFGATTRLRLRGAIEVQRTVAGRTRSVPLRALEVRLGARPVLRGTIAGRATTILTLDLRRGEYTTDPARSLVTIGGTRAALTPGAARLIGRALGLPRVRSGAWGVLAVSASAPAAPAPVDATGTTGSTAPAPGSAQTAPGGSVSTAPAAASTPAPVPLARPTTAVALAASSLRWRLRESFVRYLAAGQGVTASGGATAAGTPVDGLTYDYDFAPGGGWYDPASGTARLLFSGTLRFRYAGHGIDIQLADPQLELAGGESRMLATFVGAKASDVSGLAVFASLDLSRAQVSGAGAGPFARTAIPAFVTPGANELVMSGFYPAPDNDFGLLSTTFTPAA